MRRLEIFYDGLCPLCSREIAHYRTKAVGGTVEFVDITDPAFDAPARGLDVKAVHREMHVRHDGRLKVGVDAFLAIWDEIPGYAWLRRLVATPVFMPFARVMYAVFAKLRPLLPRKKAADCGAGRCAV